MINSIQISDGIVLVHPLDKQGFQHIKEGYEGVPTENVKADLHNENVHNNTMDKDNVQWPNPNQSKIESMADGIRAFEALGETSGDQSN